MNKDSLNIIRVLHLEYADRFIPTFCDISISSWVNDEAIDVFETLINPASKIEEFMEERLGIKAVDLVDEPYLPIIWHYVYDKLENNIFFVYSAKDKIEGLKQICEYEGLYLPNFSVIPFEDVVKKAYPDIDNSNLDNIFKYFALGDRAYRSFDDSIKINKAIQHSLKEIEYKDIKDLIIKIE